MALSSTWGTPTLSGQKTAQPTLSDPWQQSWSPPQPSTSPTSGSGPRQVPTSGESSGVLSAPGAGEQWWDQNQDFFSQPTNSQNYWEGVQGQVAGGANDTAWTESMLSHMPGQTSAVAGVQPLGDPRSYGMSTDFGPSYTSQMQMGFGPTASSSLASEWGPNAASRLDTSLAQRRSDSLSLDMGPTAASSLSMLLGTPESAGAWSTSRGELAGPSAAESGYARGDFTRDASYSLPALREKSYMERLADDPQMGFGQYYDRAHEVAQEKLDNAMAARGIWNSGAALDSERELSKDMQAERALRETDWIKEVFGGADVSKSRRLGQEMDLTAGMSSDRLTGAQAATQGLLGRVGARTQAASAADSAKLGFLGEETKRAGLKDQSAMAFRGEERMRAGQMDEMLMAALGEQRARAGLQDQSSQADRQEQRLRAGQKDQSSMAFAGEERLRRTAADQIDLDYLGEERQRISQMDDFNLRYGQEDRVRAQALDEYGLDQGRLALDFGRSLDENAREWAGLDLDYLNAGSDMASAADDRNRALAGMGGDFAFRTQDAFEQRERYALTDLMKSLGLSDGIFSDSVQSAADSQKEWSDSFVNSLFSIGSGAQKDSQNEQDRVAGDTAILLKAFGLGGF